MRRPIETDRCPHCDGEVIRFPDGNYSKVIVLDAEPTPQGNCTIVHLETGVTIAQRDHEFQWDLFGECDGKKYVEHTCFR